MEKNIIKITEEEKEIFEYLNVLRDSGIINMFSATPYLMDEFDINEDKSKKILLNWMRNYNKNGYEHLI